MNQKYSHSFIIILIIGLLAFLIYSTYSANVRLSNLETLLKSPKNTPTSVQTSNPVFDRNQVSPKDRVSSMTVVSKPMHGDLISGVQFKGKITVTGNYTVDDGQGMMPPGIICLGTLDQSSLNKMPKERIDDRPIWFCLNDKPELKTLFTKNAGTATIEIDNYFVNLVEGGVFNTADLVKLISIN